MTTGSDLVAEVRLALTEHAPHCRLLRNNVGEAWQGKPVDGPSGCITLLHPRRINFGLAPGSGDLIGPTTITITPDMVGQRVAVFTSGECKEGTGMARKLQRQWHDFVIGAGGRAGVIRSVEDALRLVSPC